MTPGPGSGLGQSRGGRTADGGERVKGDSGDHHGENVTQEVHAVRDMHRTAEGGREREREREREGE